MIWWIGLTAAILFAANPLIFLLVLGVGALLILASDA